MSHGSSSSSAFETCSTSGYSASVPCSADPAAEPLHVEPVEASRSPPEMSETASTLAPRAARSLAATPPTLPNPCTTHPLLPDVPAELLARALGDHHDPGAGCLAPEDGAADRDRLPGHDLGDGVANLHRVCVHHPGHRLLVRRHVRRRDVLLRADHGQQLDREAPRQPLELVLGHLARVAAHAAFRAAVRQPEQRALPCHPHREGGALAERDMRVVADAALRRADHARVEHAVAREDRPGPVVHPHRDTDHDGALGKAQPLGRGGVDVGMSERLLILRDRGAEEGRIPLERLLLDRDLVDLGHGAESI